MWADVVRWIFPVWCLGCGAGGVALCTACAPRPIDRRSFVIAHTAVAAAAPYTGIVRDAIVAMKRGERAYLDPLARIIAATLPWDAALIPLPTSRGRRAARGFDQSVEIARRVAIIRAVTCIALLEKRGAAQRGRSRLGRLQAVGRFRLRPGVAGPARCVVLDDVCTTGATLADGIRTLRAAGVDVVGAVVLARAEPSRRPDPAGA